MKTKNTIVLLFLFIFPSLHGQVELETMDEVKDYLNGEWQLKSTFLGWGGTTNYPTDSLDYRLIFEEIEGIDSSILCTGYRNGEAIEENIVAISLHEDFHWAFSNLPRIFDFYFHTFYMYREGIARDSFGIHDGAFDGMSMVFSKNIVTSIINVKSQPLSLNVFPNPARDFLHIDIKQGVRLDKVRIYNSLGKFIEEHQFNSNFTITLPNYSGLLMLEFLDVNGDSETKSIWKL